jgi:hypothetical protein
MSVAIRQIDVPRQHRHITQGQAVQLSIEILDTSSTPSLLDPTMTPVVSLFNPDDDAIFVEEPMTNISTGRYRKTYQTTHNDALGLYKATFHVEHQDEFARIDHITVFKITKTSTFPSYSYFVMEDQSGGDWYIYLDRNAELHIVPALPSNTFQVAVLATATTYGWLEIDDESGTTMYAYPNVMGELIVVSEAPALGTGSVGSPTLTIITGDTYILSLDALHEITITET